MVSCDLNWYLKLPADVSLQILSSMILQVGQTSREERRLVEITKSQQNKWDCILPPFLRSPENPSRLSSHSWKNISCNQKMVTTAYLNLFYLNGVYPGSNFLSLNRYCMWNINEFTNQNTVYSIRGVESFQNLGVINHRLLPEGPAGLKPFEGLYKLFPRQFGWT